MRRQRLKICATAILVAAISLPATAALVIYQDDFSGQGSVSLNGQAPDVRPGAETWTINNSTALPLGWRANGDVIATGGGVNGQTAIQLPFTPQPGNIYTLKGRISLTTGTGQWVGLGFSSALTNADGESGLFAFSTIDGFSWALHGDQGANTYQAFGGPETANLTVNTFSVNPTDIRTVLDTTGSQWKTSFFVTSANLNSGNELLAGSFTYTTNPSINAVGFTKGQSVGGLIDNFSLEVEAIPEPSAALFGALSLTVVVALRLRGKLQR
jgi:hypothetical protein